MELLSVIRRWRHREHLSSREISRRTGLSRNTARKYLRADSVEPRFNVPERASKLDTYADKLSHMLALKESKRSIALYAAVPPASYVQDSAPLPRFARQSPTISPISVHTASMVRLAAVRSRAFVLAKAISIGLKSGL